MKYSLSHSQTVNRMAALAEMRPLLHEERWRLLGAFLVMLTSSVLNLSGPALAGYAIDHPLARGDYAGVLRICGVMLGLFTLASICQYAQTVWMGGVGLRLLYRLRGQLFEKLQQLPLAFFHSNRAGDLMSRLNSDTEKVNQFFSQSMVQFVSSSLNVMGAALCLVYLHPRLGSSVLGPALLLLGLTRVLTPILRLRNRQGMEASGIISAEISDNLEHFRVIVACSRRDYFRQRLERASQENFSRALWAGLSNQLYFPLYSLCNQAAQGIVLVYGLGLVARGELGLGILISFLNYVSRFYDPLRQMAAHWSSFQTALAGWDRISQVLKLESDLPQVADPSPATSVLMEFQAVDFAYQPEQPILSGVSLKFEQGRTYALVGPTGGGKTTTASLMARLYDPVQGKVLLHGRDLRAYSAQERSQKIGFILQEPFLLEGSLRENLSYSLSDYHDGLLEELGMQELLTRFPQGLETQVATLSLGQKQIVAFLRALLRRPELLILDEASANIDTVTEGMLQRILDSLPQHTTRVVIAHRLNTIQNADEIYFVNQGHVQAAGSMEQALALLKAGRPAS